MPVNLLKKKVKNVEENKKIVKEALKNNNIDCAINTRWSFIGEFLKFLEKKDIMKHLKMITAVKVRKILSQHIFVLLYILKIIVGIPSIRGSQVLLGDAGAMKFVGFNVAQLLNGLCQRGDANQYGKGYKKKKHLRL